MTQNPNAIIQWQPTHLTDLGLTHTGINQLLGVNHDIEPHEVYLPRTGEQATQVLHLSKHKALLN